MADALQNVMSVIPFRARDLRAGIVWINDTQPAPTEMPSGGYKQSGVGRELGKEGVEDYLEKKSVYVNLGE